ncbi:MAG: cytochrome c [Planctomycetales bacterium]|nr:cytochrome c [Planctomycetales bacterium]
MRDRFSVINSAHIVAMAGVVAAWFVWSAGAPAQEAAFDSATRAGATQLDVGQYAHLHNLMQFTPRIFSGGEPAEDSSFSELQQLGVRTIVSVDGARPNVEQARKHGLRYVHIPIGYDGISAEAGLALANVIRSTEGPIYIHCHHGKHRGPAAAAIACLAAGTTGHQGAVDIMRRAGTNPNYVGLWRDVRAYQVPAPDAKLPALVETAEVGSVAAAMAQIDRAKDNLTLCQTEAWQTPREHPDVSPRQEALLLRESLHEIQRQLDSAVSEKLRQQLDESERIVKSLEDALERGEPELATQHFSKLNAACKTCHQEFRDS